MNRPAFKYAVRRGRLRLWKGPARRAPALCAPRAKKAATGARRGKRCGRRPEGFRHTKTSTTSPWSPTLLCAQQHGSASHGPASPIAVCQSVRLWQISGSYCSSRSASLPQIWASPSQYVWSSELPADAALSRHLSLMVSKYAKDLRKIPRLAATCIDLAPTRTTQPALTKLTHCVPVCNFLWQPRSYARKGL
jgi:hypothetical protein